MSALKVKRRLQRSSLRVQLYGSFALLILLLMTLAGFAYSQIRTIQDQHIPARAAAREVEVALLNLAIYEKELAQEITNENNSAFYKQGQSESYKNWEENYVRFETNYRKLTESYAGTAITDEMERIHPKMLTYRDRFLQLVGLYRERGYENFGREGTLNQRGQTLENSLANQDMQVKLLQMRRAEKNFFLRREMAHVEQFDALILQLSSQLTTPQQQTAFEEYTKLFHEIVAIDQKIGLTTTSGLRGEMRQLLFATVEVAQKTQTNVLMLTDEAIAQIGLWTAVMAVVFVIAASTLSTLILRTITRKLNALLLATKRIAHGDFDYRINFVGTDELGTLARDFNVMAENLEQNYEANQTHTAELAQSVRTLELVVKAVNEAVYDWRPKTHELQWGEGLSTLYGYKKSDRKSTSDWWIERIHPEDREEVEKGIDRAIEHHRQIWEGTYRFLKSDGTYADVQDRGFIEYDKRGEVTRVVGSLMDITRQKELERAKDEFISVASHQLRTPLGSIRWNLELLLDQSKGLDKDGRRMAQDAFDATLRMLNLVGDLLNVARIEQGRLQAMRTETDLGSVIDSAIAEMKPISTRTHIKIVTHKPNRIVTTMIDGNRFREAIQNLLSNAVKYTPKHGRVTVKLEQKPRQAVITVADTGVGIPAEEQEKLFSKFFRASNVTRTDTEGTGLGLFVVKSYVEEWGGKIWFESEEGKGTTFYMTVPVVKKRKE